MQHTSESPWEKHLRAAQAVHDDAEIFVGHYRDAFREGYRPSSLPSKVHNKLRDGGMGEDEISQYLVQARTAHVDSSPPILPPRNVPSKLEFTADELPLGSEECLPDASLAGNAYAAKKVASSPTLTCFPERKNYDGAAKAVLADWKGRISNSEIRKRLGQLKNAGFDVPSYNPQNPGWSYHRYMEAREKFASEIREHASADKLEAINLANRRLYDPWAK